ncbi:hypothetical protein Tco_0998557 [Tanacetum coccineum]
MSKPLPLGGPPGQVTIQPQFFFNKDLEYLVSGSNERRSALSISKLKVTNYPDFGLEELVPSLWIESEHEYDVSAAYKISHWWFKRKEFYITRHSAHFNRRAVRSHMKILNVVSLKTYSRYGYTYLKEIVLRRADYNEYKISESDFKNLHPNDFEDMYLLHLEGKLNHLSGSDKVNLFNIVNLWIRNIVIRKRVEDLQLGMLTRILEKLDHMVKDFKLFKSDTYTGNPVKEILVNLNLPDHRLVLTDPKVKVKMEMEIPRSSRVNFITTCSYSLEKSKDIMKAQVYVSKLPQL